jgi:hypothetical protein
MTDLDEIPAMFAALEGQTAGINLQDFVVSSPRDAENKREWQRVHRKTRPDVRAQEARRTKARRAADPAHNKREWEREKARMASNPELAERRREYKRQLAANKRAGGTK